MKKKVTKKKKLVSKKTQTAMKKATANIVEESKKAKKAKKAVTTSKKIEMFLFVPIIGLGASAGGFEAIEIFLKNFPNNSGAAIFIIQHLDPNRKSLMGSLISKFTKMNIFEAEDGMKVEKNSIYLGVPNKLISIENGLVRLEDKADHLKSNLPIDHFFRSLSEYLLEKTICVILSGTGTDGTLGLKTVKGAGGMVVVQSPEDAKYDGMPTSAIQTGLVDFKLPVKDIPNEILKYISHSYLAPLKEGALLEDKFQVQMTRIFSILMQRSGHDFSNYKRNTVCRRIERRMAVHQIDHLDEYLDILRKNKEESEALFKDLLIGVTNFFRDKEAFNSLKKQIKLQIRNLPNDYDFRVWISGCSTGEEAYSIAIIISEVLAGTKKKINLQLFSSDIDPDSIDLARLGTYPDNIVADVSEDRLDKYFVKIDNNYQIKKQYREPIIFAVHNIIKDPPFSKINLVVCRNLLIYMDQTLQKKILPLFHYVLKDKGTLFLGPSESISGFENLYKPIDSKWKIFTRKDAIAHNNQHDILKTGFTDYLLTEDKPKEMAAKRGELRNICENIVLENYSPPSVVINRNLEILYFVGDPSKYLTSHTGDPSFNILDQARDELKYQLTRVINKTLKQENRVYNEIIHCKKDEKLEAIQIYVRIFFEPRSKEELLLIVFSDKFHSDHKIVISDDKSTRKNTKTYSKRLENEIQSLKEQLQSAREEFESSNEELRSANEELQSVNEESQSANEELETSKEELQSTNEEIVTINTELQNKVDELSEVNNDINNLLSNTDVGTVFLDTKMCIKRFTPMVVEIFNIRDSDCGRPISDITSKISETNIFAKSKQVLDTLQCVESEISSLSGKTYNMRILPYRTVDNIIKGVVVTFIDITKAKYTLELNKKLVINSSQPTLLLNYKNQVEFANESFYKTFQASKDDVKIKTVYKMLENKIKIKELENILEKELLKDNTIKNFSIEHDHADYEGKKLFVNADMLGKKKQKLNNIVLSFRFE